jgi:hypothetical protein
MVESAGARVEPENLSQISLHQRRRSCVEVFLEIYMRSTWVVFVASMVLAGNNLGSISRLFAAVDPNAYFTSLTSRSDLFKAYSLRPVAGRPKSSPDYANQLLRPSDGGYAACNSCDLWITYDANVIDAAMVRIPAFVQTRETLGLSIGATETSVSIPGITPGYQAPHALMIDDEIMQVADPDGSGPLLSIDRTNGIAYVKRGQFGTRATSHSAGAALKLSTNTVPNTVRLPLGTTDGHTYLFTWDAMWTDSYLNSGLTNHKAFNLVSDGIWLEPGARYSAARSGELAELNVRSYNRPGGATNWASTGGDHTGPGVTATEPLSPSVSRFYIKPNSWTRYWVQVEQRAGDYDYVDMWMADETTEPVQVYRRLPISVRPGGIEEFLVEFNTSLDSFVRGHMRDLVSYVRNVVTLQDAGDPTDLLLRPNATTLRGPSAPRNVRIVR